MTTEQIAIVSGSAVGIAGVLAPSLTALLDRAHQRQLAQAERKHAHRVRVYERAGAYLERLRLSILRTEPIWGPVADPPQPLPDDEWTDLAGSVAVASSPEVRAAIREAYKQGNAFAGAVMAYRSEPAEGAGVEMHESRQRAYAAIDEAERVMSDELGAL